MPRSVVPMPAALGGGGFGRAVFRDVPGEDHVGPVAEHQVRCPRRCPRDTRPSISCSSTGGLSTTPGRHHVHHLRPEDPAGHVMSL